MKKQWTYMGLGLLMLAWTASLGLSQQVIRVGNGPVVAQPVVQLVPDADAPSTGETPEEPEEEAIVIPPLTIGTLTLKFVEPGGGSGTSLLPVEYDYLDLLRKIPKFIAEKEYTHVLKILQTLMEKTDSGSMHLEVNGKGVYRPLRDVILDILDHLPPEPRTLYIQTYEPKAAKLLADAQREGAASKLAEAAELYRLTDSGKAATKLLAAWQFDRGRFSPAAYQWGQCGVNKDPAQEALRLAKITVAFHLGGDADRAQASFERLIATHAAQTATIGGKEEKLVDWVKTVLASDVMSSNASNDLAGQYPGIAGMPMGWARCLEGQDIVPLPLWSTPVGKTSTDTISILTPSVLKKYLFRGNRAANANTTLKLIDGEVRLALDTGTGRKAKNNTTVVMSYIEPVMVSGCVILRTDEGIMAYDSLTGSKQWESRFPIEKKGSVHRNSPYYGASALLQIDHGRYRLAVLGDHVYALGDISPSLRYYSSSAKPPSQGTSLAAFSISGEGKLAWKMGHGLGENEFLQSCNFVSLPSGRQISPGVWQLYLVARQMNSYYLVCLEDRGGRVQFSWKTELSTSPKMIKQNGSGNSKEHALSIASPPLRVDDRVYVCTNGGVVSAVDAGNGKIAWAVQYDSIVTSFISPNYSSSASFVSKYTAGNPLLWTNGGLVVLPADAKGAYCYSPADGQQRWYASSPMGKGLFLTGIDSGRVAVSSPKMLQILDARTGKELYRNDSLDLSPARPVNTDAGLLLSVSGGICRLTMTKTSTGEMRYSSRIMRMMGAESRVGTLAASGGQLVAANANGVSVYCGYAKAYSQLAGRLKTLLGRPKWEALYRRGLLSFGADRLAQAEADFKLVKTEAGAPKSTTPNTKPKPLDAVMEQLAVERLREVCIRRGNVAKTPVDMLEYFNTAMTMSHTETQKLFMNQRLAECYAKLKQFDKAFDLAESVATLCAKNPILDDLRIGVDANDYILSESSGTEMAGRRWLQLFTTRVIREHGKIAYASRDAMARKQIDLGITTKAPQTIRDALMRWPESKWLVEGKFALAELLIAGLQATTRADRDLLGEITSLLDDCSLSNDHNRSASALAGLYALATYQDDEGEKDYYRREIEAKIKGAKTPAHVKIAFLTGTLSAVRDQVASGAIKTLDLYGRSLPRLRVPLRKGFQLPPHYTMVFSEGSSGQVGLFTARHYAFAIDTSNNNTLLKLNLRAKDAASRIVCRGGSFNFLSSSSSILLGSTSADGTKILLHSTAGAAVYDFTTGKLLWGKSMTTLIGAPQVRIFTSDEKWLVVAFGANLVAVDYRGTVRWRAKMTNPSYQASAIERAEIVQDSVLVAHGNQYLTVLDLNTGKRKGATLDARRRESINTLVSREGNWARQVGATLHFGKKGDLLESTARIHLSTAQRRAGLMGVFGKYVAVLPNYSANKLTLYSAAGKQIRTFSPPTNAWPNRVLFGDKTMYVLCSHTRTFYTGVPSSKVYYRGLSVLCYNLESGKLMWNKQLVPDSRTNLRAASVVLCRDQLVVSMNMYSNSGGTNDAAQCYILKRADGTLEQAIPTMPDGFHPKQQQDYIRMMQAGILTIRSGRLIINTPTGVTEYGRVK